MLDSIYSVRFIRGGDLLRFNKISWGGVGRAGVLFKHAEQIRFNKIFRGDPTIVQMSSKIQ